MDDIHNIMAADCWFSLHPSRPLQFTQNPQVIFLDAVGTLFGVRGTVGMIYGAMASQFGVQAEVADLDRSFALQWTKASPMAFGQLTGTTLAEAEVNWWYGIVFSIFQQLDLVNQFSDFPAFFRTLYHYFASPEPWYVYDDVIPSLVEWQSVGIELGIISNFDSRLIPLLQSLNLSHHFKSVTYSTGVGKAKPAMELFQVALATHHCCPQNAWHIGDSVKEDYIGATAAGLRGIWLQRK